MARALSRNGNGSRTTQASKYDAHHTVLSKTYGALADLRRELSDSKAAVAEREELLSSFATCADSQRAWLLLEDYFEKLSLSRKDFPEHGLVAAPAGGAGQGAAGGTRVSVPARQALPADRTAPHTRTSIASPRSSKPSRNSNSSDNWKTGCFPPKPAHLDSPARLVARRLPAATGCRTSGPLPPWRFNFISCARAPARKSARLREIIELTTRAAHEQELFPPDDWEFIQWLARNTVSNARTDGDDNARAVRRWNCCTGWRAGATPRGWNWRRRWPRRRCEFHGQIAELTPHLENGERGTFLHASLDAARTARRIALAEVHFFNSRPPLALAGNTFYLLRNAPPPQLLEHWAKQARRAGAQTEPSAADASAQDAIESRRGLGATVRRASGRAAIHFRIAR